MPDELSANERALIDAYTGPIQVIPQGKIASTERYVWVPGKLPDADGFITGGTHWKAQRDGLMKRIYRDMRFKALKRREMKA
jgi:hypothetical protein